MEIQQVARMSEAICGIGARQGLGYRFAHPGYVGVHRLQDMS